MCLYFIYKNIYKIYMYFYCYNYLPVLADYVIDLPLQNWLQQISILLRVEDWRSQIEPFLIYD